MEWRLNMNIGLFILWMDYWINKRNHIFINEFISSLAAGTLDLLWLWGGVYMTSGRLSRRSELIPVPSHGSTYVLYMIPPQNVMPARVTPVVVPENFTPVRNLATVSCTRASSETQGQSVGSGEKVGRKFSSTGERAPGYRLSPNYFQYTCLLYTSPSPRD